MIKSVISGKWGGKSGYYIAPCWPPFYRFKALICILLNREPAPDLDIYEHVHVTYTGGGSYAAPGEPTVHWFQAIVVGYGVFRNWWCTEYSDSD